ncbi:prespore-specific protein [Cavenderia fasciculata]|uniref:Prespore-specific protein n=1 Tax=Cavenderia fasciculata TaxID=261658 RepID=F4PJN2_CACFS|nr:prespore-specific protein [Cavenderia fasciculata]EGG23806.1 prespore-specific protein [Cavenderia fasciculata]|eukprot:XP_004361657.1 prespore-specific protein [Cavenderia fasciculata]
MSHNSFSIPGQQQQQQQQPVMSKESTFITTTSSSSMTNNNTSPLPLQRDRRSNRRRVSCGFHHKRHQACPENCEGRVSHPPEAHPPIQDKFTVGCSECKSYFQNKLFILASSTSPSTTSSTSTNNNTAATSPCTSPSHVNKKRMVVSPVEIIDNIRTSPIILNNLLAVNNTNNNNNGETDSQYNSCSSSPSSSRPMSPICEVPSIKSYESSPTFASASIASLSSNLALANNLANTLAAAAAAKPINLVSKTNVGNININNNIISFPVKFDNDPPEPQNQPLPQRRVSGSIMGSSLKRKSNNQSLEFIGYDDNSSTAVPDDSSPTSTPRRSFNASSFSFNNNSINTAAAAASAATQPSSAVATPTSLSTPASASYAQATNSAEAGLLHLLEAEVAKEIMSQKEIELNERKKLQTEEKETVERIQQVLDYQKIQQQMEFHRLKKQNEELEQWRSKLDNMEKDLLVKEEFLKRRVDSVQQPSLIPTQLPKLSINSNLLKHISTEMNLYTPPSTTNTVQQQQQQQQQQQPKQMSFDLLLNQQIPQDI